jgi:hypothetical protein
VWPIDWSYFTVGLSAQKTSKTRARSFVVPVLLRGVLGSINQAQETKNTHSSYQVPVFVQSVATVLITNYEGHKVLTSYVTTRTQFQIVLARIFLARRARGMPNARVPYFL